MARTRHMAAKAGKPKSARRSSPLQPPPSSIADQSGDAAMARQSGNVAPSDPSPMTDSPSMMERLFPSGLPQRYTRPPAAAPSSIGSVISSSQESSSSEGSVADETQTPALDGPILCTSPRHGNPSRPTSASSNQSLPRGSPHGPDITAEDRIASFLRQPSLPTRASLSTRAHSTTPLPSTLAVLDLAPDPTPDNRTSVSYYAPSETDDEATISDVSTVEEDWSVFAGLVASRAHPPTPSTAAAVLGGGNPPGHSEVPAETSFQESFTTAKQELSSSPVPGAHGPGSEMDNLLQSQELVGVPEPASQATPRPADRSSQATDVAPTQEQVSPPVPNTLGDVSDISKSTSSRESVTPSLLEALDHGSKAQESTSVEEQGTPSLPTAMDHEMEVPGSVSSGEPFSPSSPGVQGRAAETPGTSPFEGSPKEVHESRPSTPASSDASVQGLYVVIQLGSEYNSPESPRPSSQNAAPTNDAPPSPVPSRKRKATEAAEEVSTAKKAKTAKASKTPTASTPKTAVKREGTRRSTRTPATASATHMSSPAKPSAQKSTTRKSARKPAKAGPVATPSHRVTKPSQGRSASDGPYGLRSRETRKVSAKVAMNLGLDAEEGGKK
ncbi:hypothetical protein QBC39DRAFT_348331 [Podospora conica]|nr:hypothetical protein QBC39DRAFT_348331 [Schizothecium conicum]